MCKTRKKRNNALLKAKLLALIETRLCSGNYQTGNASLTKQENVVTTLYNVKHLSGSEDDMHRMSQIGTRK